MKLLVAIPALNEEKSIQPVVEQIKVALPKATILVIDDGSSDKTGQIALMAGAKVISIPFNVGVGGAMRVAFKYAFANGYTHVMQIDADGQHLPSEGSQLLNADTNNSIVVGSRFLSKDKSYRASGVRRTAMLLLAFIVSRICRTKLTDVTSGFRLTSGQAIELFANEYPREYLGDTVESLIIAHHAGIKITEVPVSMKYRENGNPSQNIFKSSWHLIRALLIVFLTLLRKKNKTHVGGK
jgi:glycosyltransferase involved in cell wall biosynthesis